MDAIVVDQLSYSYQAAGKQILKNINFRVAPGEIVALIGLSGCGKSTLCLCLGGIIPHYLGGELAGQVTVNGKNTKEYKVSQLAREVGLVFQDPDTQLFSPTVEDEIAFAPENLCLPAAEIDSRVHTPEDHVYGQWDMHETLTENYWHLYYGGGVNYPSCAGLSTRFITTVKIYSTPVNDWALELDGRDVVVLSMM